MTSQSVEGLKNKRPEDPAVRIAAEEIWMLLLDPGRDPELDETGIQFFEYDPPHPSDGKILSIIVD